MPESREYGMLISFGAIKYNYSLHGGRACSSFGRLRGGLIPAILKTKPKGNAQLDSPDSYCAMNKHFYELCEHKAIDELAFKKFA